MWIISTRLLAAVLLSLFIAVVPLTAARRIPPPVTGNVTGVALIFNGDINDFGFTFTLDQSRLEMQRYFGGSVVSDYIPLVAEDETLPDGTLRASDDCIGVVQALYSRGYRLIIAPSRFVACIQSAYDTLPTDVYYTILGGPQPRRFTRISSGFVRDWEARYTSGIIAGAYSTSGKIGYITGFNSANHARLVFATYLGARLSRPDIKFYVMDSNSFDNTTRQLAAARTLIEEVGCDILISYVNPLDVHFYAKQKNIPSIFSDGDGRILVGETVLTSIIYRRTPLFITVARRVVERNWIRVDYGTGLWGGYSDDAVGLASYGGTFYDKPAVRVSVERVLQEEIAQLRIGAKNGFCGVSALGLRTVNGSDCMNTSAVFAWRTNLTGLEAFPNIFYLGTADVPLIEVFTRYSDGVVIAVVTLASVLLALLLALAIISTIATSKKSKWIMYASPPFMFVILGGAALVCVSIIIMNTPEDLYCSVALWTFVLGLNLMQGSILVKTGRLFFFLRRAKKIQRVDLPNRTLFFALIVLTLVACIVLTLGTSLSPFRRMSTQDPQLGDNQVRVYCGATPTRYWPVALVVYQGILSLLAAFFAFKTRNMYDKLNESKSVALANYNIMFIGIVIIVLLFSSNLTSYSSYTVQAVGMLWIAASTVAITFVPKLYKLVSGMPDSNPDETPRKSVLEPAQGDQEMPEVQSGTVYEAPPVPSVQQNKSEKSTKSTSSSKPPKRGSEKSESKSYFESSHAFYSKMSDTISASED